MSEEAEEAVLRDALKLSFAERCGHAHWKVRSKAYETLAPGHSDAKTNDNIDVYFKDALHKIVNESNANALDVALEKTNVRLRAEDKTSGRRTGRGSRSFCG